MWNAWNTNPMCWRRTSVASSSSRALSSTPSRRTWPESGLSRPAMRLRSVDFPIPDSPMMAMYSPSASSKLMSCSTVFARGPENDFERFLTDSTRARLLVERPQRKDAGLHSQVPVLHIAVPGEIRRGAAPDHAPFLDDVVPVGDARQRPQVLVDDEDRQSRRLERSEERRVGKECKLGTTRCR